MPRLTFRAGEWLFRAGDWADVGYLIEEGVVELRTTRPGREGGAAKEIILLRLGRGELVGDMAAVEGRPHSLDAFAASDDVAVLAIDGQQIRERIGAADPTLRILLEGQIKRNRRMLALLRGGADEWQSAPNLPSDEGLGSGKFRLETQLREALAERRLEVRYQPILEIASSRVAGYEALVRWEHPELGAVDPEAFIHLAEETSLIVPVGEYVFDAAFAALDALRGPLQPFVAVNVSARQLTSPGLIERVVARRQALALPPGCIKVEITESQALDPAQVVQAIAHCHAHAIGVSLDDFGTRYAHLAHLHEFAFDSIKIDQAFVHAVNASEKARHIVRAIVVMAGAIGAQVVAEGVETPAQLEFLKQIGCQFAQGFLIGKALALETIVPAR